MQEEDNARRKLTTAEIYEEMAGIPAVDLLTAEARTYYEQEVEDGFCFKNFCFESILELIVARLRDSAEDFISLNLGQIKNVVGYDESYSEKKTLCVYCLSNLVFEKLTDQGFTLYVDRLKRVRPERLGIVIQKLGRALRPAIAEALKDDRAYFFPRCWKKILMKSGELGERGDFERNKETEEEKEYGNFVDCEFDDPLSGDQLELALVLGIAFNVDEPEWRTLAACGQQGNRDENGNWKRDEHRSHLYQLQTFSGKLCIRKRNGRVVYGFRRRPKLTTLCLPAEPYGKAIKRLKRIQSNKAKNQDQSIDYSKVTSHSMFALALDVISPELVKQVDGCKTEEEIKDVISTELGKLSSEEIGQIRVFVGENLGDKDEGKTIGRDGNEGKPPGLGPFGGKVEPQEWANFRDTDAKRVLSKVAYKKWEENKTLFKELKRIYGDEIKVGGWEDLLDCDAEKILKPEHYGTWKKNGIFNRQMKCLDREVFHESGFKAEKFLCEVLAVLKGRGTHIYHLWLVKMESTSEGGAVATPKELLEMNSGQTRFWPTINELFQKSVGGVDASFRKDRPYCSFLNNLSKFIKRFKLAVPDSMEKFQEKLKKSRSGLL